MPPVRFKSEPKPVEPTSNDFNEHDDFMQIDGEEEEEENDVIVRDMDVYLSPQLAQQLHLLQFPLQHPQTSYSLDPQAARIKPKHNMVELDQAIPTNIEQNGEKHMINRTYASHTIPVTTHLALGKIFPDDESPNKQALHLVPLTHITQMRPTFAHIDEEDDFNNPDSTMEEEKAAAQKEKEKKPLMFQKKESERAALARKNSYAYKKASEEGEEWTHLHVQDYESSEYESLMQQLECPQSSRDQSVLEVKTGEEAQETAPPSLASYVRSLNYLPTTNTSTDNASPEEPKETPGLNLKQLASDNTPLDMATIGAHLTSLLSRGRPIPFSILRNSLPPSVPDTDILTALASCAVMVRGNFVLQSRLIEYPRPLAKARTFVLLLLQSMGVIHRNRLEQVYGLQPPGDEEEVNESYQEAHVNPETILMLLNQVARKTPDGWVLKVEEDTDFQARFPQNTTLHMQYWGRQMIRFRDCLERYAGTNS